MEDTAKNEITVISEAEGLCETAIQFSVAEELLCYAAHVGYYYWGMHPQTLRPSCLHVFLQVSHSEIPDSAGRLMTTDHKSGLSRPIAN